MTIKHLLINSLYGATTMLIDTRTNLTTAITIQPCKEGYIATVHALGLMLVGQDFIALYMYALSKLN